MYETNLQGFKCAFQELRSSALPELIGILQEWLPPEAMESQEIGERSIFTPTRTLWLFLYQILTGNLSCEAMVQKAIAWLGPLLEKPLSPNTSAYSQARTRLSTDHIDSLDEQLRGKLPPNSTFHSHPVKMVVFDLRFRMARQNVKQPVVLPGRLWSGDRP